jgi:hypothetical protein
VEDDVLTALNDLKGMGYIDVIEYNFARRVIINQARRREILKIINSTIDIHEAEVAHLRGHDGGETSEPMVKASKGETVLTSRTARILVMASILILGLVGTVGATTLPAGSTNTAFVSYNAYENHLQQSSGSHPAEPIQDYTVIDNDGYSAAVVIVHSCHDLTHTSLKD